MKVVWYTKAEKTWRETLQYIYSEYGYHSAVHFRKETNVVVKQIRDFPNSAPIEDMLKNSEFEFRSVAFGEHNKLIYYIAKDAIYVADIWDTRREPKNQANETMKNEVNQN